jgi:hypothetical protein
MTTKLEELKALMGKYNETLAICKLAPCVFSTNQAHRDAHFLLQKSAIEFLPHLIAVAEAAKDIILKNDLHWSDTIEHRIEREKTLKNALEPLTKETK